MIRFDDEVKQGIDFSGGVEFAYYDSEYTMLKDGSVYKKVERRNGTVFKPASVSKVNGTLRLVMCSGDNVKTLGLSRLVMQLLKGDERGREWIIKYKDGNKFNCSPDNLEWVKFKGRGHGKTD